MRKSERAFTLFEVLGAVSLLAIAYTALATAAMQGLRSEGQSQRILRASLLADWELGEFEAKLDQGLIPELGVTEGSDDGGFAVSWEVTPLEPPLQIQEAAFEIDEEGRVLFDAIFLPISSGDPAFVQIQLTVSWFEGADERSVTRTTFAVDQDAAAQQVIQSGNLSANPSGNPAQEPEPGR
jgi:hypothetical protein